MLSFSSFLLTHQITRQKALIKARCIFNRTQGGLACPSLHQGVAWSQKLRAAASACTDPGNKNQVRKEISVSPIQPQGPNLTHDHATNTAGRAAGGGFAAVDSGLSTC